MEQARSSVDNYFTFVQKIISSYPSGGTELGEKLKSSAQKNLAVTYEFVQKLSHAKNFNDIIRIQTECTDAIGIVWRASKEYRRGGWFQSRYVVRTP